MHGIQRGFGKAGKNAEDVAKTNKPVRKAYKLRYLCGWLKGEKRLGEGQRGNAGGG